MWSLPLADEIESSLNPEDVNSLPLFAHAAFIKIRDSIVYSRGLSSTWWTCIVDEGDCDEQSDNPG